MGGTTSTGVAYLFIYVTLATAAAPAFAALSEAESTGALKTFRQAVARRGYPQALKELSDQIDKTNGKPKCTLLLARAGAYDERDEHGKALDDLNAALKIDPDASNLTTAKAAIFYEMNKYPDATKLLSTYLETHKDCDSAYYLRGKVGTLEQNWTQAYSDFSKCIGPKKPMTCAASEYRGGVLMHLKRYDEAAADYTNCLNGIRSRHDDMSAWVQRVLASRARAYKMAGKTALADKDLSTLKQTTQDTFSDLMQ